MFGAGAAGFFAVPYTVIIYPLFFLVLIRLWSVSHRHGFVTPADFVRTRFDSPTLALLVAITGIVATMPYIALQLVGIEAVLKTMGVTGDSPLARHAADHHRVRDPGRVHLPVRAAGAGADRVRQGHADLHRHHRGGLLPAVQAGRLGRASSTPPTRSSTRPRRPSDGILLNANNQLQYITLALGSALALFLYPHSVTGVLASRNRDVIKRNMSALPAYSFLLGLIALLGYVAIAAGVKPLPGANPARVDSNTVVPLLFDQQFPDWFAGIAFAAIGIGALVPAAIMSIAAANLFTRNIYKEYLKQDATPAQEAQVSKIASLVVKLGAVAFIVFLDPQFSIDLQLIGGVIILQTLPSVALGLYTRWLHRGGLIAGWVGRHGPRHVDALPDPERGDQARTHFGGSAFPLAKFGFDTPKTIYVGFVAVLVNLLVAVAASR